MDPTRFLIFALCHQCTLKFVYKLGVSVLEANATVTYIIFGLTGSEDLSKWLVQRIIHKREFTSPIHSVSPDNECAHRSWSHLTIVSRVKRCKHEPLDAASWVIIPFDCPVATVNSEWPSYNALYPLGHLDDAWWWWTVSGTVGTSQTAQRLTWSYSDDDDLLNLFIY